MLQVAKLEKSYGSRCLFREVSFAVGAGERVGLVGRNGSGKSTLFKILRGEETADGGEIHLPKGYRLGFLDQHIRFSQETVLKEAALALPRGQELDLYKAEALLFGLGFSGADLHRPPQEFSGGYQLRINLVKCLLQEPDLLLLDEPTNYLDILSLHWMRQFLKSFRGEVILITHDRQFMDSVVTHVMSLHRQGLRKVEGDTSKYYTQLAQDEEIYEKTRLNQERKVKEMQAFVDRFRAKATKAKQAQSRLKQIEKIKPMLKLSLEDQMGFEFNFKDTPAKVLLTVENLAFAYPGGGDLFSDLSFRLEPGSCWGIIGKNGHGKTTLLNVLAGTLQGRGQITPHPDTVVAYYQQTNKKKLDPAAAIYQEIASVNPELGNAQVRAICGAMMFSGDDAEKKIAVLSGGEQGRVLLGQVIAKASNVLLLDEPTNHLDMESIAALIEQIEAFPGGVILVSHDEELLSRLATHLIVFKNGGAQVFLGGYPEFLEKEGWGEEPTLRERKSSGDRKEERRQRAERIQARAREIKPVKEKIESLESRIIELESTIEELNKSIELVGLEEAQKKGLFQQVGGQQIELANLYGQLDEAIEKQDQVLGKYQDIEESKALS